MVVDIVLATVLDTAVIVTVEVVVFVGNILSLVAPANNSL